MKVVVLTGGVGGTKLVDGLCATLAPEELTIVVNTGDDFVHWGLTVCPDLDTVMYTLSDLADHERGWGLRDETWNALQMAERYGGEAWFRLGDRDLATHVHRTEWLRRGERLTAVTQTLCSALGVGHRVLPMCDAPRPTLLRTDAGDLPFQEWFVGLRAAPAVAEVLYGDPAPTTPEVSAALDDADLIVLAPSNPYVSIRPILALDGIVDTLRRTQVIAVSPIVHGAAVKGPLAAMLHDIHGCEPSARAALARYDFVDLAVIEHGDDAAIPTVHTHTVMRTRADRIRLAQTVLEAAR